MQFLEKLNFWRNIDRREPYKNGEYLKYLKLCKEIIFVKIICSTHQRKCSTTILGNFWKIEFLKEYPQARALQKWWKFVLSQFVLRKYFLAKLFVPLNKRSDFPQFQAIFGKLNFWRNVHRRGSYKNGENLNYLKLCKEIFFWQNCLFHSSKEKFPHNLRQFLENWIFEGISTGADVTKMVKICIISFCAKKIFFGKIICSTHQRKCFSTILHNFWKIDFFVPLIKGKVSPQFKAIFGKLNFWRISTGASLTKMVKFCIISICAKKIFFGKIICSISSKEVFLHNLIQFLENWIFL